MHQVYRKVKSGKKSLYNGKDALLVRPNLFHLAYYSFFLSPINTLNRSDSRFIFNDVFAAQIQTLPKWNSYKVPLETEMFRPIC